MKELFFLLAILYASALYGQRFEIRLINPEPYYLNQDLDLEIYMINNTADSLVYFDSKGPSWNSFQERWDLRVDDVFVEVLPMNGAFNHKFSDSLFLTLRSGDTALIRTKAIHLDRTGHYSLTYTQNQDAKLIQKANADSTVTDSLISRVSTYQARGNVKFMVHTQYDTIIHTKNEMTWEEWKGYRTLKVYSRDHHYDNLYAALQHPQEVYMLEMFCNGYSEEELRRIGRLKNLKSLTLFNYELNFLPKEIAALDIFELTIEPKNDTPITFKEGLSDNHTIRELNIEFFGGFPKEILALKDLEKLDISKCSIAELPALDSLQKLEVLLANDDQIKSVNGCGLPHLSALKELNLSGNKEIIDIAPILECTSLEFLVLNRTGITAIPADIENLTKLKKLSISNKLVAISDSIGNLSDLRYLSLGGNRSLDSIPSTILKLNKLLHLDVSSTRIKTLPEGIAELPLEKVFIYNTECEPTKDYKALKKRLGEDFKE